MNETVLPLVMLTTSKPLKPCTMNWMNIWKQIISAPLGGASFILNGLLIVAIMRNKHMRSKKEHLLTCALAFADFAEGLASFIGAVYRLPYYYGEFACYPVATPLYCMALPHNILWRWSDTATAYMLVVLALDRLFAITQATYHMIYGGRVAAAMTSIVYGISFLYMLYAWIMPIQLQVAGVMLKAVCSTSGLIDKVYTQVIKYATGCGSALSVVINFVVAYKVIAYLRRIEKHTNYTGEKPKRRLSRREIKFTIASLVKGLCTLLLDSSTRIFGVYAMIQEQVTGFNPESGGFGSFLFAFNKLNGVLNVFIFAGGQSEVRRAVLSLFGLGHLVENLEVTKTRPERTVTVLSARKTTPI